MHKWHFEDFFLFRDAISSFFFVKEIGPVVSAFPVTSGLWVRSASELWLERVLDRERANLTVAVDSVFG